jgi:hypothetical protein
MSNRNREANMTNTDTLPPRLKRAEASAYLRAKHGISRTVGTLAKLAVVGGGPSFRKLGTRSVVYDVADLDAWAASIMSKPVSSTSELSAA